jgi:hypothetical protein
MVSVKNARRKGGWIKKSDWLSSRFRLFRPCMGSLKKRRKAKINRHKRRKKLRLHRHKKRTWQK